MAVENIHKAHTHSARNAVRVRVRTIPGPSSRAASKTSPDRSAARARGVAADNFCVRHVFCHVTSIRAGRPEVGLRFSLSGRD